MIRNRQISDDVFICPMPKCIGIQGKPAPVTPWMVEAWLPRDMYAKFIRFRNDDMLLAPDEVWFQCPDQTCNYKMIASKCATKYECWKCKNDYCMKCNKEYHGASPCDAAEELRRIEEEKKQEEEEFAQMAALGIKKCPHCGALCEKRSGCNFMT
jgi:hypothetical protein